MPTEAILALGWAVRARWLLDLTDKAVGVLAKAEGIFQEAFTSAIICSTDRHAATCLEGT
jgi:hypothetical protein